MLELELDMITKIGTSVTDGEWPREAAVRMGALRSEFAAWWSAGIEIVDGSLDVAPDAPLTPHQELCAKLVNVVRQAEATHENNLRKLLRSAANSPKPSSAQVMATIALLERRHADRWRKREMEKTKTAILDPDAEMRRLSGKSDEAAAARRKLGG